jgi:hypothetical protein
MRHGLRGSTRSEKIWNLFDRNQGFRSQDRVNLSRPKPDRAFYFTIHNFTSPQNIPSSERWLWEDSAQEKLIENFSLDVLDSLWQNGLQFCLSTKSNESDRYRPRELQCFPWLIIEHKRANPGKAEIEKCYCQAANAGSAALMMLQTAAKYAENRDQGQHVPPVVTITTISKEVRVWVVFDRRRDHRDTFVSAFLYHR